jgi:hypothetical protein
MKRFQPWHFEPLIHLEKSFDPGTPFEYEKTGICLDEA